MLAILEDLVHYVVGGMIIVAAIIIITGHSVWCKVTGTTPTL